MKVIGIDPGKDGAIAVFDLNLAPLIAVHDMPNFEIKSGKTMKKRLDEHALVKIIGQIEPDHAWLERVSAMPGQGVSSTFSFGTSYGIVKGILAALKIPYSEVTPQSWTKALSVPKGKDGSRKRACELFPDSSHFFERKKDHNRADSALIGYFGAQQNYIKEFTLKK